MPHIPRSQHLNRCLPRFEALLLITLSTLANAWSLVNPSLQPIDLFERHNATVIAQVASADAETGKVDLVIKKVVKGDFAPKEVTLSFPASQEPESASREAINNLKPGAVIVAFVGKIARQRDSEILAYLGKKQWHQVKIDDLAKPGEWTWEEGMPETMSGTFSGDPQRLGEMMEAAAAGSYFFPAQVLAQFSPGKEIADIKGPISGVALFDLDGDGQMEAIAASEQGLRVFQIRHSMEVTEVTKALGLEGVSARSLSIADADADGNPDLLLDGSIFLSQSGIFQRSELLPEDAGKDIKVATFVDLNRDGYPDVLISRLNGGLAAYVNPAPNSGSFTNQTTALGFDEVPTSVGGFLAWGDWNMDGTPALFHAIDRGFLMRMDGSGAFVSGPKLGINLKAGAKFEPGLTGAGSFGPIWRDDRIDLIVPGDTGLTLLTNSEGKAVEVTGFGNEIAQATGSQIATLAEDMDADGRIDLFTFSRDPSTPAMYHTNRGYGSFMRAELYRPDFLPAAAVLAGLGGAVAADVNGDGANDLLVGGLDGKLTLIMNESVAARVKWENPTHHQRRLLGSTIINVQVAGRGTTGAIVTVRDGGGTIRAIRQIGNVVLTGCASPFATNIAVMEPGQYEVAVRYSDGHEEKKSVVLAGEKQVLTFVRENKS